MHFCFPFSQFYFNSKFTILFLANSVNDLRLVNSRFIQRGIKFNIPAAAAAMVLVELIASGLASGTSSCSTFPWHCAWNGFENKFCFHADTSEVDMMA